MPVEELQEVDARGYQIRSSTDFNVVGSHEISISKVFHNAVHIHRELSFLKNIKMSSLVGQLMHEYCLT